MNPMHSSRTVADDRAVGSPISDEAYDVLTALQVKLKGLEVYRAYQGDGMAALWAHLSQQELTSATLLVDELERLVRSGRFRMKTRDAAG